MKTKTKYIYAFNHTAAMEYVKRKGIPPFSCAFINCYQHLVGLRGIHVIICNQAWRREDYLLCTTYMDMHGIEYTIDKEDLDVYRPSPCPV